VDGIKGSQTRRAIRRYTYGMPGDYGTPPAKEIDDETDATFQSQLESGEGKREIFQGGKLPGKGEKARVYIDHDYFYHSPAPPVPPAPELTMDQLLADWYDEQGHAKKDADKLDRFEIPLECRVYLVGKADSDGTKAGIDAPGGIGEVDVEWTVRDPVEDTSFLPVPTADIPSRGKQYVEDSLVATGQVAGNPTDSQDDCPESNNRGQRKTGAGTNPNYFRIGDELPPFHSESVGAKVYCKVHQDTAASPHKIGRSGVLFRGSYIAGDNYAIEARISFERLGNKSALTQSHEGFIGKPLEEILFDETGEMTIWRRHHVSALIDWPDPNVNIDWGAIAVAYWIAHCELNTAHQSYNIGDIFSTDADKNDYLDKIDRYYPDPPYHRPDMSFDSNGLYPLDVPGQGLTEDPNDYRDKIDNLGQTFTSGIAFWRFVMDLAQTIASRISQNRPAGCIFLRASWIRAVTVRDLLPVIGIINPFSSTTYQPGYTCVGIADGVSVMDNGMPGEQDGFLYAHESGHCRYLSHHEIDGSGASEVADDHDVSDHNCTMCYPNGIASRPGLTWNVGDATQSRFCGKCILKLRGWNVRDPALPASS